MKQTNSSFLSCLNLAVTDKFQNTRVLCLGFLFVMKMFVPTRQQQQLWQQRKNANEPIKLIETQ